MGFVDLMETIAIVLERECGVLPHNAHADCALQLTHAAAQLRMSHDIRATISALRTKFTVDE